MFLQIETRPLSHEQLVTEVKGIYESLVMIEAKCADIDETQLTAAQEKDSIIMIEYKDDQWKQMVALHLQLLYEHHDFLMASNHPSAGPGIRELAAKCSMPGRMWWHGIHGFLEVLRHRLPSSLEHMLTFIHGAYSMLVLLYETVPTLENTWIECLGDLGRYRMVIDPSQGEMWKNIAFLWYNKAVDKSPDVGRLYHHLAILARPFTLEQLSLYMRALTCFNPFENARSSILKLINPILQNKPAFQRPSFVTLFFQAHGNLFTSHFSDSFDRCDEAIEKLNVDGLYEIYISKASFRFKEFGVHAAVSNIAALLGSGTPKQKSSKPRLRLAYESAQRVKEQLSIPADNYSGFFGDIILSAESSHSEADISTFLRSSKLASISLSIPLKLANDRNVYPLVHVYLVFIWSLILVQQTWSKFEDDPIWKTIEKDFPWAAICSFLNTLAAIPHTITAEVWAEDFPGPGTDAGRPLPEDFVMRGQLFSRWYFPHTWFTDAMIDADERTIEVQSTDQSRATRMLWLGLRIASVSLIATFRENTNVLHAARWIHYDTGAKCFVVTDRLCTNANPFPDRTMEKT